MFHRKTCRFVGWVKRRYAYFLALLTLLFSYLLLAGSVDNTITANDKVAIEKLMLQEKCQYTHDFDGQIACIGFIQAAIKRLVPDGSSCAPLGEAIEPYQFIQRGFGCCNDRSRFTEKALSYYGFETRHVALYDADRYGMLSLFVPRVASHATTEVKTRKGWMGVDSNHLFLLLTRSGTPLTYKNYRAYLHEIDYPILPSDFYKRKLLVVYGLYSRHGQFHGRNLPSPEFVFSELVHNVFESGT